MNNNFDIQLFKDWAYNVIDDSKSNVVAGLVSMLAYAAVGNSSNDENVKKVIEITRDEFKALKCEELRYALSNMLSNIVLGKEYNEIFKEIYGLSYSRDLFESIENNLNSITGSTSSSGVSFEIAESLVNSFNNKISEFNKSAESDESLEEQASREEEDFIAQMEKEGGFDSIEDSEDDGDYFDPDAVEPGTGDDYDGDGDNDGEPESESENAPVSEPASEPVSEPVSEPKSESVKDANEDSTVKSALESVDNKIDNTIVEIKKIYTSMFGSGYGVIQPEGILCGVNGGSMLHFVEGDYEHPKLRQKEYLFAVWSGLQEVLELKESRSRQITYETINSGYNYYPYKLLEFTFGRYLSSEEDIANNRYKKSSASNSWETYWDKDVKPKLKNYIQKVVTDRLKDMYENGSLSLSNPVELYKGVNDILKRTISAYAPAIVVSEDSAGRFKIRFSDYKHRVNSDVLKKLELDIRDSIGTVAEDLDGVSSSVTRLNDTIKEIEVKRDSKLCGTVPLFAYKALRKLREQGKNPSWKSIILGRAEDDSIYIGNSEATSTKGFNTYRSDSTPVIHVSAGSRSGKGVMTLNLLASAYASEIPVFYLDCKPDMSSMLLNLANKNGVKTFVMNGGGYDKAFDTNGVVAQIQEHYHIPEGLESVDKNMSHWSALKYLKALDFLMWLMPKVDKGYVPTKHENMVVVADELQKLASSWAMLYNNLSVKKSTKLKKGEEDAGVAAAGKIIRWYGDLVNDWKSAEKFGLKGIKPTMFLIYQEHQKPSYKSELKNREDDGNVSNTYFFNTLHDLSSRGFIGYDVNSYHAGVKDLDQSGSRIQPVLLTTKGRKYCNVNDRYFAWVNSVNSQDTDVKNDTTSAIFIKPFLILNDADENGVFVQTLKNQLKTAVGTDENVEKILSGFRTENGVLDESIGFEGYMNEMASSIPGYSIGNALSSSYEAFMYVLDKFGYMEVSGAQDPMDYFTDFRPEFMPSWSRMDEALNNGKKFSLGEVEDTSSTPEEGGSIESNFDGTVFDADGNAQRLEEESETSKADGNVGNIESNNIGTVNNMSAPMGVEERTRQRFHIGGNREADVPRSNKIQDYANMIISRLEEEYEYKLNKAQRNKIMPLVIQFIKDFKS